MEICVCLAFLTVYWVVFCYVVCGWVSASVERDKEKKISDMAYRTLEREREDNQKRLEAFGRNCHNYVESIQKEYDQYSRKKLDLYGEEVRQLEMDARRILATAMKMTEQLNAEEEEDQEEDEEEDQEEQTSCFTTVRFNRRL